MIPTRQHFETWDEVGWCCKRFEAFELKLRAVFDFENYVFADYWKESAYSAS